MMSEPACEILAMNVEHDIGAGDDQVFVAAFEVRAAEIRGGEIGLLQHGAHGAIQDEDALAQQFAKGQALLNEILSCLYDYPAARCRNGAQRWDFATWGKVN